MLGVTSNDSNLLAMRNSLHGHSCPVNSVVIRSRRTTVVSGISRYSLKLWQLNTGQEVHTLLDIHKVLKIALTPDGETLASSSKDKTLKLWNLSTKEEIYTIAGHSDIITSVVISPDGKTLASASEDTTIKLWNLRNGEEIRTLEWPVEVYYGFDILFSFDGQILLSSNAVIAFL